MNYDWKTPAIREITVEEIGVGQVVRLWVDWGVTSDVCVYTVTVADVRSAQIFVTGCPYGNFPHNCIVRVELLAEAPDPVAELAQELWGVYRGETPLFPLPLDLRDTIEFNQDIFERMAEFVIEREEAKA